MAKSQCMYCGGTGGCIPGCDGPCCGGGQKKNDPPKKVPKHNHKWEWKRRSKPIDGSRPYDEYFCTYPGCKETQQRPV